MAVVQQIEAYSVSQLNYYLKEILLEDEFLNSIAVKGEISGYKEHKSGHIYFTLKDQKSSISCVIFRRYKSNLTFVPENGMDIVAFGSVFLYEKDASCQLYVEEIFAVGAGRDFLALDQLKKTLAQEGLFDEKLKKPLPLFPQRIAVVTSAEGAAWADIQRIAYDRWPQISLDLFPTLVQGEAAAAQIAAAIIQADKKAYDLIIVARGGGSYEDLSAFNTELVVRAIAAAKTPIITAIGHEIDYTLADLAADIRAATPSHAAELSVPDSHKWQTVLQHYQERLEAAVKEQLARKRAAWQILSDNPLFTQPSLILRTKQMALDTAEQSLLELGQRALEKREQQVIALATELNLLNPLSVLARGYAFCTKDDGQILLDARQADIGEKINVTLHKGLLCCRVDDKEL
ncbi:MAG: exodeoxyribonuclease VII large subunit [Bacillota bacterium]|jgi:exodeoxyribonuclease VII large subunit